MDYLKKLESSVQNFEAEVSKLTRIEKLISDTESLLDAVSNEKLLLKKSVAQLENMRTQIEKDCTTFAEFAKNEAAARQKLLADIHKNILADSKVIIDDLSAPLDNARRQLVETCELLKKFIETHQKSQEIFLSNIETILIKYNTKNLEVYNNITGTLSNKVEVAENNISTNLNLKFNTVVQDFSNLNSQLEKNSKELRAELGGVTDEINSLKETLSTIKNLVFLAIGTGAAACALHFLK